MDWKKLYEGYDATSDLPACIYWRETLDAFPDAKVILTVRGPEARWKSWKAGVETQEANMHRLAFLHRF